MPINFNIGGFFDKFKNAELKEIGLRQIIVDVIAKNTGAKLDIKEIALKNKIIRIQGGSAVNPALRNQIFMKKELILSEIRAQLPGFIVSDLQ